MLVTSLAMVAEIIGDDKVSLHCLNSVHVTLDPKTEQHRRKVLPNSFI